MRRSICIGIMGLSSLALVACGGEGPSADEAKVAIDKQIASAMPSPLFTISFKVTDIKCTADGSAYRCDVTKTTRGSSGSITVTSPYRFVKADDGWQATPVQ